MDGAMALTVEIHFLQREVFFLFGEFDANVSGAFENHHRVGGGVSGGLMANVTDNLDKSNLKLKEHLRDNHKVILEGGICRKELLLEIEGPSRTDIEPGDGVPFPSGG
jgi:hypothetical protein